MQLPPARIDLEAYLHRIAYSGSRAPTLDTLKALHLRHTEAIPFENLDPFLGRNVVLDAAGLQDKLVRRRRGGYCFEQNGLFRLMLTALGFEVTGLAARVLWNAPEDAITARTHMLLRVDIDGRAYLADVGFGGQTLTGPIRLEAGIEQTTPHEPYRVIEAGDGFRMQARLGEAWRTLYHLDLQPQLPPDYEVSNYYVSTHPQSHFRGNLVVARPTAGCRYALLNGQLAAHHLGGPTERQALRTVAEVRDKLETIFLLTPPHAAELEAAVARKL